MHASTSRSVVVAAFLLVSARASAQSVLCTDPRGCPDMIVDAQDSKHKKIGWETFLATDCIVQEGIVVAGRRRLLKFSVTIPNIGPGALIVGDPNARPELYNFANCHNHPHMKDYVDYRLWTLPGYNAWVALRSANPGAKPRDLLAAHPEVASQMVVGGKHEFCLIDEKFWFSGDARKYLSCDNNQGTGVGWANWYDLNRYGQSIDITGVPSGKYQLEIDVNPERVVQEADYENNSGASTVNIR